MTEPNCNVIDVKALPLSTQPLMDYDSLYILRQKPLESVFLAPPPDWKAYGPEGELFQHPVQVVVLGAQGEAVHLAIYAHPSLTLAQGPAPDKPWRQRWTDAHPSPPPVPKVELDPEVPATPPESVNEDGQMAVPEKMFILDFGDELYNLHATFEYFCLTVKPLLESEEYWDTSRRTRHGYATLMDWILERAEQLSAKLDQRVETLS